MWKLSDTEITTFRDDDIRFYRTTDELTWQPGNLLPVIKHTF